MQFACTEQAVKLDPNFTLAWAYLSIAQIQSAPTGFRFHDRRGLRIPLNMRSRSIRTFQKFTSLADTTRRTTRVLSQNFGRPNRVFRIALML